MFVSPIFGVVVALLETASGSACVDAREYGYAFVPVSTGATLDEGKREETLSLRQREEYF